MKSSLFKTQIETSKHHNLSFCNFNPLKFKQKIKKMPAKTIPVGRDATEEEESIVISGISGRFSDCLDINTFRRRILAGECLIRHDSSRWPVGKWI